MKAKIGFHLLVMVLLFFGTALDGKAAPRPGFLVLAPDRGFMGNNEVSRLFTDFQKKTPFPSALVFASKRAQGDHEAYLERLRKEIDLLKGEKVSRILRIVVIPLFLSGGNALLREAEGLLKQAQGEASRGTAAIPVEFAEVMSHSHLISQILYDRLKAVSRNSLEERLVLLGTGVESDEEAQALRRDLGRVLGGTQGYFDFKESRVLILHDRESPTYEKSKEDLLKSLHKMAASSGRTLLIPFQLGFKADGMMSTTSSLRRLLQGINVALEDEPIVTHPNALRWLLKTARQYQPIAQKELGIVIMNHGSSFYSNERIWKAAEPLMRKYKVEFAMSMADPDLIQEAVDRLEERGATRIVLFRVYSLSESFQGETEYILGIRENHAGAHHDGMGLPLRVRSSAVLHTMGGVDDELLAAKALLDQINEVSQDPAKESILLVAHGTLEDEANARRLEILRAYARHIQERKVPPFREVRVATWREDWPEKREKEVKEIKDWIQKVREAGATPIVVGVRTEGHDPARRFLKGVEFVHVDQTFSHHPNFSLWMERKVDQFVESLLKDDPPSPQPSRSAEAPAHHR